MRNESIISEIQAQLKHKNVTVDVKANSDPHISPIQLSTTVTVEELGLPGLKNIMAISYPHQAFGRFGIQYLRNYVGINVSSSMNTKPSVNLDTRSRLTSPHLDHQQIVKLMFNATSL